MAIETPTLGEGDLAAELQYIHRTARRTLDTAFFGRGEAATLKVDLPAGAVLYRVVPVRSEIELRRALIAKDDRRLLALVDYDARQLPVDLAARLARGEVREVSSESRLRRRFQASWIHPDVQRLRPLCDALLTDVRGSLPAGAARLDPDAAWRLVLAARCALSTDAAFTLRRLLQHVATTAPTPRWIEWMRDNPELRPPFEAWMARAVDPIAPALWSAWEESKGPSVAALTFALGPLGARLVSDPVPRIAARAWVERVSPALAQRLGHDPAALTRWAECETPLRDALQVTHPRALDALLREADALLADAAREPELRAALSPSENLALAWDSAQRDLAAALDATLAAPGRERFVAAVAAFDRLKAHRNARSEQRAVDRARAALRLLGWMNARPTLDHLRTEGAPWQLATELARDYVHQGGFADLCRRQVRGSADGPLGRALAAVEEAADRLRDDDDQRFAGSLRAWVEHGRRDDQVVPIERALDHFAVPFLERDAARRLLVVLLDGSAWANVVELLLDLEDRHHHGVMRWQPTRGTSTPFVAPVLAALPTVTQVSRAAFFEGRVPEPGDRPDTGNDPRRFAAHRGLRAQLPTGAPKLLLEPDVQLASGHASPEALALVRSEARVVAVVLNAIDDQLHGSRQVEVRYTADTIKPLLDLLGAAREAGRAVLFASDHGHVPGARLRSVNAPRDEGGGRWRTLDEGAVPDDGERAFGGAGVWTPRKGQRLALRTRETEVRGSTSGDGQHGGATLAEVVAPTVLLVSDALSDDVELEARPLPRPGWWDLDWSARVPRVNPVAARPVAQPSLPLEPASLPAPVAPVVRATPPAPTGPQTALGRAVLGAEVFKTLSEERKRRLRDLVVPTVELLVQHGGQLSGALVARGLQQLPGRAENLFSVVSEIVNLESYPVLSYDPAGDRMRLDVDLLRACLDLNDGAER